MFYIFIKCKLKKEKENNASLHLSKKRFRKKGKEEGKKNSPIFCFKDQGVLGIPLAKHASLLSHTCHTSKLATP